MLLSLRKSLGTGFHLSIYFIYFSFQIAKLDFSSNLEVSILVAFFKSAFVS